MTHRLFLDTSILIAAAGSPDGGSASVLEICSRGMATALVSRLVFREAERNIKEKMTEGTHLRYFKLLANLNPETTSLPAPPMLEQAAALVASQDAHVLAAARNGDATHLITLDRKHLLTEDVRRGSHPMIICTPVEYLQKLLEE